MEHTTELRHFGVKGMRWGVRSSPPPAGTVVGSKKQTLSKQVRAKNIARSSAQATRTRAMMAKPGPKTLAVRNASQKLDRAEAKQAKREKWEERKSAKLALNTAKKAKLKEINAVRAKKKFDYAVNGAVIAGAGHVLIGTLSGRGFSVLGTAAVAAIGGGIGSAVGKRAPLGPEYQK